MRSSSFLGLVAAGLAHLASATSPTCAPSQYGLQLEKAVVLYNSFCGEVSSQGFASRQEFYAGPWASFSFIKGSGSPNCDFSYCQSSFSTLMNSCVQNDTVFGGGIDAGCGMYNFTIWNPDETPAPVGNGKATATIDAATVNTASAAPTSLSSTSQPASLQSSLQIKPTSISSQSTQTASSSQLSSQSSSVSPASSSSPPASSTTSPFTSKQSSVSLTLPPSYLNTTGSTDSISAPVNGSSSVNGSLSGGSSASGTQTPTSIGISPSTTRSASPAVSNSDADMIQASGYGLLAVAFVFSFLL